MRISCTYGNHPLFLAPPTSEHQKLHPVGSVTLEANATSGWQHLTVAEGGHHASLLCSAMKATQRRMAHHQLLVSAGPRLHMSRICHFPWPGLFYCSVILSLSSPGPPHFSRISPKQLGKALLGNETLITSQQ